MAVHTGHVSIIYNIVPIYTCIVSRCVRVVSGYESKQQFAEILSVHTVVYIIMLLLLCHFEILLSAPFLL